MTEDRDTNKTLDDLAYRCLVASAVIVTARAGASAVPERFVRDHYENADALCTLLGQALHDRRVAEDERR